MDTVALRETAGQDILWGAMTICVQLETRFVEKVTGAIRGMLELREQHGVPTDIDHVDPGARRKLDADREEKVPSKR